ncbi:alpha/beta hydrolase [Nocardia aurantia]|uniref:Acetyl esterase n=1 Tax=Nocardia aurantia TaxID=2585199 RepID=A0A7K0DTS7_9NOCA|nr:alpha/beta hydrolase [Nocardia aurantia]MQY29170.1 Acetyl esterase [Nocardia aurantia]
MVQGDAFHPDLRGAARWLPRSPVNKRSLPVVRALSGLASRRVPRDVRVEPAGDITVRVYRPPTAPARSPGLLWIHGGGYVIGSAAQDDWLCRHFARELGIVVVSADYRLAPEHPFPVPLHDCHDALAWMARQPDIDAERIAIGGASAGGGLAAALALLAHERGEVRPVFQLLAYPMIDDRTVLRTDLDESHFRLWNNKANAFGWQSYTGLAPGSPSISGLAAPARYEDLSGLPPAWIGVGSLDLFHDEDLAYAKRLADSGIACETLVVDGAFHGFDEVFAKTGVAKGFRTAQVAALAAAL